MLKYLPGGSKVPAPQGGQKVSSSPSVPDVLVRWIGEDANQEGIRLLFEGLQQPLLNKQVRGGKEGRMERMREKGRDQLDSSVFVSTDDVRPA